jgi:hypothetical protein
MNNLFYKNTSNQLKDKYEIERENNIQKMLMKKGDNNTILNDKEFHKYQNYKFPQSTRNNNNNVLDKNLDYNHLLNNLKQDDFVKNINSLPHPKMLHNTDIINKNKGKIIEKNPIPFTKVNNEINKYDSSYKVSYNQKYTAEIGEKRKLSNIIYNGIISSLKNNKNNSITEYDIDILLSKLNLDKGTWMKEDTKKFVNELQKTINFKKYSNNIIPDFSENNQLFEKDTKEKIYYISIDSNDRDLKKWPNPNHYQINFEPNSFSNNEKMTGFINKSFNNVKSVEMIESIIPIRSNSGDNYKLLPYILLEVEELGSVYQGTNDYISQTFSKLIFEKVIGSYCYSSNNFSIKKIFNPRIALNKFTVRFRKPNGKLYNFGKYMYNPDILDKEKIKPNNILTFKITCIVKSLDTMFLNKKN